MMNKFIKNQIVEGKVTGIQKYGIFIGLDEYFSGLIHISEISDDFVSDINNIVSIGDTIRARVLEVDEDRLQVKLSIKNLNHNSSQKRNEYIKETKNGFNTLKEKLNLWILEKNKKK